MPQKLTPANTDDRKPVRELSKGLLDKLYADKGNISKALCNDLLADGIILITTTRENMKAKTMAAGIELCSQKRFIIETINDKLKNISQIEHFRHRSLHSFMLNLWGANCLVFKTGKPSLNITSSEKQG